MRPRPLLLSALGLLALGLASPAPAAAAGPALTEPPAALDAALRCTGDLAGAPGGPMLLVHGTGVNADQNWAWGYRHDLLRRGHGVCTVDLPEQGLVDTQRSVEYVVHGTREAARRSGGRRVSLIGHSQGAALAVFALRVWTDLAPHVDDVVGIAGVYDNGSEGIGAGCRNGCPPPFHQFAPGSRLLAALRAHPLPAGPSFSAIATLHDDVVTPQPRANELPGGTSVQIQEVCPGRRHAQDHIFMAGDAVMHALVLDALTHPGPVDRTRVSAAVCLEQVFAGVDLAGLLLQLPGLAAAATAARPEVADEPPVRCAISRACPGTAARLLGAARLRDRAIRRGEACGRPCGLPRTTVVVVRAVAAGQVRLRFDRGRDRIAGPAVAVRAGQRRSLAVGARVCRTARSCRRLAAGVHRVRVQARAGAAAAWRTERTLSLRVRSR